MTLSTTAGSETHKKYSSTQVVGGLNANVFHKSEHHRSGNENLTAATVWYMNAKFGSANNNPQFSANSNTAYIKARCAYV